MQTTQTVNLETRQTELLRRWAYEGRRSMSAILRELIDREAERRGENPHLPFNNEGGFSAQKKKEGEKIVR